jgi:hypothetical protein
VVKVFTSAVTFYEVQIAYANNNYQVTLGSSFKCSGATTTYNINENIGPTNFACQSNSLIYGDFFIRIDRPTNKYATCTYQVRFCY